MPSSPDSFRLLARNASFLLAAQIIVKLLGLLTGVLLANALNAEGFGTFSFLIAFSSLFIPLCDLGVDTFVIREIAADPQRRGVLAGTALASKMFFSLLTLLLIVGSMTLTTTSAVPFSVVVLAALLVVLRTFTATFLALFRGIERMGFDAGSVVSAKVFEVVALLIGIWLEFQLSQLLQLLLAASAAQLALTVVFARHGGFLRGFRVDPAVLAGLLRGGILFAATGIFINLSLQIDVVMLSFLTGDRSAGLYRAAHTIVFGMQGFAASLGFALFPLVARTPLTQRREVLPALSAILTYGLSFALLFSCAGFFLSNEIIAALYNPTFALSATTFGILVWWLPLFFPSILFAQILGALNVQKQVLFVAILHGLLSIGANLLLIPLLAENGAALATILTEAIILSILFVLVYRNFGALPGGKSIGKLLGASLVFAPLLILPREAGDVVPVGVSALAYVTLLYFLRVIRSEDLSSLFRSLSTRDGTSLDRSSGSIQR